MKKFLRNTVAMSALAGALTLAATPAAMAGLFDVEKPDPDPTGEFILPYYGDINPFHGDINPFHGDINPFYGDISPFWGDIEPFWGDINPFHGDIHPFYGDIDPFWGDSEFYGDIEPFYGDIEPFWGDIQPFWGDIGPFWGDIIGFWGDIDPFTGEASSQYATLAEQIDAMFVQAEAVFGEAYTVKTGLNFRDAFMADLLARYGMDLSDPDSLAEVTSSQRSYFFLAFYDGLMSYTGIDHVDHWMPMVNWSPALSQSVGGGDRVTVGLLDFSFSSDESLNVRHMRGSRDYFNFNHGAAVASLINAPLDGEGVMGVAPGATLVTYNPFDETLSTNWEEIRDGVQRLVWDGAEVINMSLGMRGWTLPQEWANIMGDLTISLRGYNTLYVVAAGNDGSTQTTNINWTRVGDVSNLLVVGSVDPNGNISRFSNRPGTACLTIRGRCSEGNRLMDRFLVAPGELLLVSDGAGGVTRLSGTSFAAPLVSGAAALVMGRWGWLDAGDVADVLLLSATDLGEEGTDAVYGRGLLNIDAALSPLDEDNLFALSGNERRAVRLLGLIPGKLNFHARNENTIILYEALNDTYRDFEISLDDVSVDYGDTTSDAESESYLTERLFGRWGLRFSDTEEVGRTISARGNLHVTAVASRIDPRDNITGGELSFQAGVRITDTATDREVRFGAGEGALALNGQEGFGLFSDHRPETGGVNPVLGFASGGVYAMGGLQLGENTRMSVGMTATHEEHLYVMPFTGEERPIFDGLSAYEAAAFNAGVQHQMSDRVMLNASYTYLREDAGLLGAQGSGPLAFDGGSQTDAVTFGAEAVLPFALTVSTSATVARTRSASFDGGILALPDGTVSTAYQITARRDGVFGGSDALRFSLIQPLHIEAGALEYTSARVTDRETGEMAVQTDRWELGGERPLLAEILYATPMFAGAADLSVFTRTEISGSSFDPETVGVTSGARFSFEF